MQLLPYLDEVPSKCPLRPKLGTGSGAFRALFVALSELIELGKKKIRQERNGLTTNSKSLLQINQSTKLISLFTCSEKIYMEKKIGSFNIDPFRNDVIRGKALWKQSLHDLS